MRGDFHDDLVDVDLSNQTGEFPQDLSQLGFQNKTSPVAQATTISWCGKSALINAFRQGTRYPLKGQGFCASPVLREMLRVMLREMLPHLLRQALRLMLRWLLRSMPTNVLREMPTLLLTVLLSMLRTLLLRMLPRVITTLLLTALPRRCQPCCEAGATVLLTEKTCF